MLYIPSLVLYSNMMRKEIGLTSKFMFVHSQFPLMYIGWSSLLGKKQDYSHYKTRIHVLLRTTTDMILAFTFKDQFKHIHLLMSPLGIFSFYYSLSYNFYWVKWELFCQIRQISLGLTLTYFSSHPMDILIKLMHLPKVIQCCTFLHCKRVWAHNKSL